MDIKLELLASVIAEAIYNKLECKSVSIDGIDSRACRILEEIVCIFEKYNIDAGFRHDF